MSLAVPSAEGISFRASPHPLLNVGAALAATALAPNTKKRKLADTSLAPTETIANPAKRREHDISHLIEYLEGVRGAKEARSRKRRPHHIKMRTTYSNDTKAFVVYLRFGSLTEKGPAQHYPKTPKPLMFQM